MILYYTGTGNTLAAAQQMQKELGGELICMTDCNRDGEYEFVCKEGEYLGLMVPVYFWGIPASAAQFLEKVQIEGAAMERTFLVAVCGGTAGAACEAMEKKLAARGISAGYKTAIKTVSNYALNYNMPEDKERREILRGAEAQVQEFTEQIKLGKQGDYNRFKGPAPIFSPLAYSLYSPRGMTTNKFIAEDRCVGCSLCQSVCPVGAIEMQGGKPRWVKKRCDRCLACYHRCPVNAVQVGAGTKGKGQYVHPALS